MAENKSLQIGQILVLLSLFMQALGHAVMS